MSNKLWKRYSQESQATDSDFIVQFQALPCLIPELLPTTNTGGLRILQAVRGAGAKRYFYLQEDWRLCIETQQDPELSGEIVIPRCHLDKKTLSRFDGASVPLPWLVSCLTFGVLRPLGVMLTASIVHDFAFEHGHLYYQREEGEEPVAVDLERHQADWLFYRIIQTVNAMPITAYVGWLAVRVGWLWVPYNGEVRTGKLPLLPLSIVLFLLVSIGTLIGLFGLTTVISIAFGIYVTLFLLLQWYSWRWEQKQNRSIPCDLCCEQSRVDNAQDCTEDS